MTKYVIVGVPPWVLMARQSACNLSAHPAAAPAGHSSNDWEKTGDLQGVVSSWISPHGPLHAIKADHKELLKLPGGVSK